MRVPYGCILLVHDNKLLDFIVLDNKFTREWR